MRSTDGVPAYSALEVAKHSRAQDAWLIISGKVLDITSWLEHHPGGEEVLLALLGRDATRDFEEVGHSDDARSRLDTFVIGTLRASTDEERQIGLAKRKSISVKETGVKTAEIVYDWVNEHVNSLKTIAATGALVVGISVLIRQWSATFFKSRTNS